ncbi:MAG: hypothetical protein ACRENB_13585 [Gemmatimonadales bacterium]
MTEASRVPVASALVALALTAGTTAAQQPRRCQLQLEGARTGVISRPGGGAENYFQGGNVRYRCIGQNVRVRSDSVASYQGQIVYFVGNFRYEDETATVTSDFGTYYKDNERWEARGNVVYRDRKDGTTLSGPWVDYFRRVPGLHEEREIRAEQRPTLTVATRDSLRRPAEPYRVVADRILMRGDDRMWGSGRVTIDRSDLEGRADSLALQSGDRGTGALVGRATLFRASADSFRLTGKRIDLALERSEITYVTGRDSASLTGRDLDLDASTIGLDLAARKVVQTLAWGRGAGRAVARADDYEVRADSLAIDTPEETLRELRGFGGAWVGFRPDTAQGERDWLKGDTLNGAFADRETASGKKAALRRLEARGSAQSFYRVTPAGAPGGRPTINVARADRILLTMAPSDSLKVQKVEMFGNVDGLQANPEAVRADTTRRDTTARRPR